MLHELPSGLKVILQENHSAPVAALQVWVNAGSAEDPERHSGLAHFLEHMVFKGTARWAEGEIAKEIEGAGGQINAWTSYEQTVFHVVVASRFFGRALSILADAMQNARFDEADLQRERQVILEEIKMGQDSPARVIAKELFGLAFRKHPYRRPVIGRPATVKRIQKEHVQEFFKRRYSPANMTLVVVGDFSTNKVLKQLQRLFPGRDAEEPSRQRIEEPAQRQTRVVVKHRDVQESYISMAFHIPGLQAPETPVLDLAAVALGEGESSRLVRLVKNEQQKVTHVNSYAYTPRDPGLLIIGATAVPGKEREAVEALLAQVFALSHTEVTADELSRAKTIIESDLVWQKETVQGQARKLGFYQTATGRLSFEREYYRRVSGATAAILRQTAARFLKPENLSLVVFSPRVKGKEASTGQDLQRRARAVFERARANQAARVERGPGKVLTKVVLGNGAKLLIQQDSTVPVVSMRAVWNGGLRYENPRNNGINNLLAALVTRGTQTRGADQINETIEKMAGSISGFSGYMSFGVTLELLASNWEQGLEILADCVLHPAFKEDEVERSRRQALEDILASQDSPGAVAMQLFNRTLYKQHPFRMNVMGQVDSVSGISRNMLVRYYRRHFKPGKMVLAVVGDVDPARVKAKFQQLFTQWPRAAAPPTKVLREPPRQAAEDAFATLKKQQAHLVLGYPGTTVRSKDRYPLEVMVSILSGQGGRLFMELRERRGLAYQIGAFSMEGIEPGYLAVVAATSPEKVRATQAAIEQQLARLKQKPISAAELKRVQRYLVGTHEISLQRKSTKAAYLAFSECYGLGHQSYTRYAPSILAVTPADIQRVARKYLVDKRRVVVLVRPEELSPGAATQLGEKRTAGEINPDAAPPRRRRKSKKRSKTKKRGKGRKSKARKRGR